MKTKIWVVIIIIILGVIVVLNFGDNGAPEEVTDVDKITTPFTLLKNEEIIVPGTDTVATLLGGRASFEVAPDSASRGSVTLLDDFSSEWTKEDRKDLAVIFAVNTGGTGTFYYLVLFDVTDNTFTKKSEMLLGDRIRVTKVGIGELVHDPDADYRVTVQTLIREEDDSFATEPTVPETRTFYVTNQLLEEVEVGKDDT